MASEEKLNMLKDKLLTIRKKKKKKSFSILRKENAGIRGCKGYKKKLLSSPITCALFLSPSLFFL